MFLAFPVIASQLYMFVAPGLYRAERKAFLPFLIATPILFLLGAALVYFVAMPLAMTFFLSMQQTGDDVQARLSALDGVFDFSNQPYEFSYAKFAELNPLGQFLDTECHLPTSGA